MGAPEQLVAQMYLRPGLISDLLLPPGPYSFTVGMGTTWYGSGTHFAARGCYGRGISILIETPTVTALHHYAILAGF